MDGQRPCEFQRRVIAVLPVGEPPLRLRGELHLRGPRWAGEVDLTSHHPQLAVGDIPAGFRGAPALWLRIQILVAVVDDLVTQDDLLRTERFREPTRALLGG